MKVLISSLVYKPEQTGYRPHDLAVGLSGLGHDVRTITGVPSYPFGKVYEGYKLRPWQWEYLDGVKVLRVPYVMNRSKSAVLRMASYSAFSLLSMVSATLMAWKPDLVWTNQIGYPGVWLTQTKGAVHVHEVQDMWPEWTRSVNLGIGNAAYSTLDALQTWLYNRADRITTISSGFRDWLVEKGVSRDKITIIPNWADTGFYYPCDRDAGIGEREGFAGHFNVMYVGNIGAAQALSVVLAAAQQLSGIHAIQFVFVGDGLERERIERESRDIGLSNVKFVGKQPYARLAKYMAWADLLFLHLKKDPAFKITIPSKTYSYLASGRPILAGCEGDVAALIEDSGAGMVIPPEDPDSLSRAVLQIVRQPANVRDTYGVNARKAFESKYDRNILIRRYEELFLESVNGKGQDI